MSILYEEGVKPKRFSVDLTDNGVMTYGSTDDNGPNLTSPPEKVFFLNSSLQKLHESVDSLVTKHSSTIGNGVKLLLFFLLTAHFAWATYYYINRIRIDYSLGDTMCDGYGFLMLMYIFITFGATYKLLVKPFVIHPINLFVWKPMKRLLKIIFGYRIAEIAGYLLMLAAALVYLIIDTSDNRERLIPLGGLCVFLTMGYLLSKTPSRIDWQPIIWGVTLQFCFGLLTIRWEVGRNIFKCAGDKVSAFLGYAQEGSAFVYNEKLVFEYKIFAFQALATIYFLNFMINILYHYGIMQGIIKSIGKVFQTIMGTSLCESVNTAANIFLGQSEAPLLLKPYLGKLTASEFHAIITSGFATTSGTVLAAYISYGAKAEHLITATVMAAPTALYYSKLVYPQTEVIEATKETIKVEESQYKSVLDAASKGASEATFIVLNIIANLIAFIAFVYFINGVLAWMGVLVGYVGEEETWSIEALMGYIFTPVAFIMGVPWDECRTVGSLIGVKMMVNEFAAFAQYSEIYEDLTLRTQTITTYALVGFGNPGSIGLMISALGALVPEKSDIVTAVVFRAYIAGTIVCLMTASMAGLLIPDDLIKLQDTTDGPIF